MRDSVDIVNLVEEENVKFIRLTVFDIFGEQKSLSIMPHELQRAFSEGVAFDGSSIAGFEDSMRSDLFLEPDPTTAILIPWRSMDGAAIRMFCDITRPDRSMYPRDSRYILKQAVKHAAEQGLEVHFGTEVEFYLFKRDEEGNPTRIPQDEAGYFDTTPKDGGENIRRDICNILLEMGIFPESSHHENGPGQHEVVFRYADPLSTADNTSTLQYFRGPDRIAGSAERLRRGATFESRLRRRAAVEFRLRRGTAAEFRLRRRAAAELQPGGRGRHKRLHGGNHAADQ